MRLLPDQEMKLGLLIKTLDEQLAKRANSNLAGRGLTSSQARLLMMLYRAPDHTLNLKQLESRFRMAQSTISGIVSRLEGKGMIANVPCADRRCKQIRLTDKGLASCSVSEQSIRGTEDLLVSRMTAEEQTQFARLLRLANDTLREEVSRGKE